MFGKQSDKQMMRLRAMQMGMFSTRRGIFDYYTAFEGLSAEEAGKLTEIECKYRGIPDTEPTKKENAVEGIKNTVVTFISDSVKNDPAGSLQAVGGILSGAFAAIAGVFTGNRVAQQNQRPYQTSDGADAQLEQQGPAISIEELMAQNGEENAQKTN